MEEVSKMQDGRRGPRNTSGEVVEVYSQPPGGGGAVQPPPAGTACRARAAPRPGAAGRPGGLWIFLACLAVVLGAGGRGSGPWYLRRPAAVPGSL